MGRGDELILCFIPSFSLSLLRPLFLLLLSLPLCLLIVHVTMSITQLLISFGLRNSIADLSKAADWNLPSMTGALCVCVCVNVCTHSIERHPPTGSMHPLTPELKVLSERWDAPPQNADSQECLPHCLCTVACISGRELFRVIWNISGRIVSNWITEYRIENVPYVLFCHQYTAASI